MELSFNHPVFAILLLLIPALWLFRSRNLRIAHGIIRTFIFLMIVIGLMQPVIVSNLEKKHFAIILDQSDSLSDLQRTEAREVVDGLLEDLGSQGTISVVQMGGEELPLNTKNFIFMSANAKSPLGDALEIASQSIPHGVSGSITVISDGLATDKHWSRAIEQVTERGIPVHSFNINPSTDVYLSKVRTADVRPGESVTLYADVIGTADDLSLSVIHEDSVIAQESFDSRDRERVEVSFGVDEPGFMQVLVEVSAAPEIDADASNNALRHVIAVQDPIQLLYIGGRQSGASAHIAELLGAGFSIEAPTPSSLTPDFDFSRFDVVMLDDVPSASFDDQVLHQLSNAVRNDGIGLVHSGGEAAFGDGGYHDTPLTDLLPVEIPGDQDKIDPSVGLAIILDTSGSMAGTRIELAKHIGRIAVRRMRPHDRIGIVEFYGNKHWAVPMQPATNKIEIDRAIGRMKAIGGTVLYPAIQEAYYGLQNVNTRYKHIILITDAGVEDSNYERMVRRINRDRITLSTILVGQGGHNQIMSDIANWGGGRFYSVGNQFQLVELIFKQSSTKKSPMYKRGSFELSASRGPGWWGEVLPEDIPPINGYVEVESRAGAETLLNIENTAHPVIATWHYGLGRITAIMTEPVGEGTQSWRNWPDYSEFLGRVLRRTASDIGEFEIELHRRYGSTAIFANRISPNPSLVPETLLYELDSSLREQIPLLFAENAPGLFEMNIPTRDSDDLYIGVANNQNDRLWRSVSLASWHEVPEKQVDLRDALDLSALSDLTGGQSLAFSQQTDVLQQVSSGELSFVVIQIWPWLLLLALLLYFVDLAYRRWPRSN